MKLLANVKILKALLKLNFKCSFCMFAWKTLSSSHCDTLTEPLSTQVYKWVFNALGEPCDGQASYPDLGGGEGCSLGGFMLVRI